MQSPTEPAVDEQSPATDKPADTPPTDTPTDKPTDTTLTDTLTVTDRPTDKPTDTPTDKPKVNWLGAANASTPLLIASLFLAAFLLLSLLNVGPSLLWSLCLGAVGGWWLGSASLEHYELPSDGLQLLFTRSSSTSFADASRWTGRVLGSKLDDVLSSHTGPLGQVHNIHSCTYILVCLLYISVYIVYIYSV
jgi:hypothetical protein